MSKDKKKRKRHRTDALKAAVMAELENCSYRLEFIIQTVASSTDLSETTFTREGLRLALKDLQGKLEEIGNSVQRRVTT